MKPKVSIIIPAYNAEYTISRALKVHLNKLILIKK